MLGSANNQYLHQNGATVRNYVVTTFNSPNEALHHFQEQPEKFQLVITDLTMPEMTGDDFTKAIRVIREDIPVLLFTGYAGSS